LVQPKAEGALGLGSGIQGRHRTKAIIFDIDGVLADSRAPTANALRETLRQSGIALSGSKALSAVSAGHDAKSMLLAACQQLKGEPALLAQLCSRLVALTNATLDEVMPTAIAHEVPGLAASFSLGVATNRVKSAARRILQRIGISGHISALLSLDDAAPKPSPQMVLLALSALGVGAANAVFVGDKESDLRAGEGAGVRTIMVDAAKGLRGCLPFLREFCNEAIL
jgi:phosphoglycolate phosphatase-like HAD superfamily hydrolase